MTVSRCMAMLHAARQTAARQKLSHAIFLGRARDGACCDRKWAARTLGRSPLTGMFI